MIKIGAAIYVSITELEAIGASEKYLRVAMHRFRSGHSKQYANIPDPDDARNQLIQFNSLPGKTQERWITKNGDPNAVKAASPKDFIKPDIEAYKFYSERFLKPEEVEKYTVAAQWLNMLKIADTTNPFKKTYGITRTEYYEKVVQLIKAEGIDLPANYSNLRNKLRQYITGGYAALIPARSGNKNASKLGELQKTFLRSLYANPERPRKLFYTHITWLFNQHVLNQGWEQVTEGCIYKYLSQPSVQALCYKDRHGKKIFNDKYDPIIHRERPTHPDDLWVLDGSAFELYYQENGKRLRLYVVLVADASSWAILGAGIGESETQEVVMEALRRACILTESLPHQLLYDNSSANKACEKQFKRVASNSFPATVGNAKSKIIEPLTTHLWDQVLRFHDNFSFNNVNAKRLDSHINPDLALKVKDLPNRDQAIEQCFSALKLWNERVIKSRGKCPKELYKAKSPRKRAFSFEDRLRMFGTFRRKPITYTNEGITLYINGQKTHYWVHDTDFYIENIGSKFQVQCDKNDVSKIALYKNNRFVHYAEVKETVPMARIDFKEGDGKKLNKWMTFKKEVNAKIAEKSAQDKALLEAEGLYKMPLMPGMHQKDALNGSEGMMKQLVEAGLGYEYTISEEDETPSDLTKGIHSINPENIEGYLDIIED